jgi:hypothetical protein
MNDFAPHFCKGYIPVAFVLSAPGNEEVIAGRPAAGATGENLEGALTHLNSFAPTLFLSTHRYDYRLTNAYSQPLAKNIATGRTEASRTEILGDDNTERFLSNIRGCTHIILCGEKAGYLSSILEREIISVSCASHIGNKGLNGKFKLSTEWKTKPPVDRRQERIRLWASKVLQGFGQGCK